MDKKALSLPILVSLVIGNMIGTGIYILPAFLAQYGTLSLVSWVYTSLGAMLLALIFTRLNKRFPLTGGPYIYCRNAFGELTGFIVACTYWIGCMASIAGVTIASVGYLGFIFPSLDANQASYQPLTALILELIFVWLFTAINLIGIHTAGVVQLILTIIKLAPLLIITILGISKIHPANLTYFLPQGVSHYTAISSGAALTFWAFIGLESATLPAENTQGYRHIYLATIFGTLVTALIYIASTFVLMGILPSSSLQQSQFPFAEAGILMFGADAAIIIAVCAVFSGLGTLNATILVQGQIIFAAARDHLFPKRFAVLTKHDVPFAAQLLSAIIVSILIIATMQPKLLSQFNNIALLAATLALITYLISALAELKFILSAASSFQRFLFQRATVLTLLAIAYSIWMLASITHIIILGCIIIILCCIPIYFLITRMKHTHAN